jgi:hypothetical protein
MQATKLPRPRRPPHSIFSSFSGSVPLRPGGTCAETTWRARGEFLRGGTVSSNPSSSSGESVSAVPSMAAVLYLPKVVSCTPASRPPPALHQLAGQCQLPTSDEPPLTTLVRHHSGGWPGSGSSASLVPLPANRSAALAGHEHHTFKDRGEVAGGAYNHKTMPDWRVKRHRSVMNRRADHIERKAGENQPHCRRRHGH